MQNFITLLIVMIATRNFAAAATVKQLVAGDDFAIVSLTGEEQIVKPFYLLATKDGQQCRLPVVLNKDSLVKVSTSNCAFKDQLVINQALELPLINEEIVTTNKPILTTPPSINTESNGSVDQVKRNIKDLGYLPLEGQSQLLVTGSTYDTAEKINVNGSIFANSKAGFRGMDLTYVYGITDRFSVAVLEEIVLAIETESSYGPASTINGQKLSSASDGLGDPILAFSFRAIEQSDTRALSFDLSAGYLTKLQDAKSATKDQNGNAGRGGDGFLWQAKLTRKFGPHSVSADLSQVNFNKRTSKSDTTKLEKTGGGTMKAGLHLQTEITQALTIGASAGYTSVSSLEQTGGAQTFQFGTYSYANFSLNLKYEFIADTLCAEVSFLRTNEAVQNITTSNILLKDEISGVDKVSVGLNLAF